ncbi:MAG: extracellular solute-binding protein [Paracoccaceae bacterium]
MRHDPRRPAIRARAHDGAPTSRWLMAATLGGLTALAAVQARADAHETVIESHGYNEYDELKYPADFARLDYVNPDAPLGGEASVSANGTFDSMNPFATLSGSPGSLASSIYERIMVSTDDEVGSLYCLLCETVRYPEDQAWVEFDLRTDVTFSDGTPMTAEDVIFTHELFKEQGTPSYAAGMRQLIASAEAVDEHTVRFEFQPDARKVGRISQMGASIVMSADWFEETGARLDEPSLEVSPGTAEYVIGSVDPGRQIVYERNPDYWGADHPLQIGRGNYDAIRIEYFADTAAAFEAFKAGVFTLRRENSSINWATAYDFPAIENGWVVRETLESGDLPAATGFVFNLRRDKFQDVRVREALGLMYNFTWTNDNLQYGLFQQRESFWENERLKAVGLPEGAELEMLERVRDLVDPSIFTEPAVLPHESGDRPLDRGNLRRALALMAEAGWTPGEDGLLRDADGDTLDVEFLETRQSFDRIVNPYIENLQRLGVNVTYNRVDPSQYQARTQSNDFDMIFGFYVNGLQEGSGFSQRYSCEDADDVFNPAGLCLEAIDELGRIIKNADDYDTMAAAVMAADRILRAERFIVPVWYLGQNWMAYFDFYRYPEDLPEFGLGYLDYWWIDEAAQAELVAAGALR